MASIFKTVTNTINNWFIPLIVGLIFMGIGIACFFQPADAYLGLAFIFRLAFVIIGISEIVFAISNREEMKNWGWLLVFGILNLLIGILMFTYPEVSEQTLPFFIGFLVLFRSIMAISLSLDMKDDGILDWGNMMVLGVLGVLFSFLLIFNPVFAGMTAVFWTGIVLVFAGATSVYFAFQLRKVKRLPKKVSKDLKDRYDALMSEIQTEIEKRQPDVK